MVWLEVFLYQYTVQMTNCLSLCCFCFSNLYYVDHLCYCLFQEGHYCQGFAPVIDGEGGFLPDKPRELRKIGEWAEVPLMAGQTTEDGSLYALGSKLVE